MIDALILATAHEHKMPLVTFDTDFRGLHGVRILKRKQ
jgi:predicted nucleic acid-binding protein